MAPQQGRYLIGGPSISPWGVDQQGYFLIAHEAMLFKAPGCVQRLYYGLGD